MRILEIITLGETGGAQTVLVDLVKGLASRGYKAEIDVVCGPGEFIPSALASVPGIRLLQVNWLQRRIRPFTDIRALFELQLLVKTGNYQLVHCHSSKASWLTRFAAALLRTPRIVMTVHGLSFQPENHPLVNKFYRMFEKAAIPFGTDYVFVSPNDMSEMTSLGLEVSKCRIIPNGRPIPPRPVTGLRAILPIPEDAPIICMVARLSVIKNPVSFIRIAGLVKEMMPQDRIVPNFVLIGDGELRQRCQQAVQAMGLEDTVYLLGHRDSAAQYYWDADLALLTSHYEACPLAAIEAMAAGVPVIASDVGGTGQVVIHGETGYLYGKEDDAARHIVKLITEDRLRSEIGENSIERYRKNYTVEKMINEYADLLGLTKLEAGI